MCRRVDPYRPGGVRTALLGRARGGNDAVRFFPRDYVALVRLYDARQFFAAVAAENGADTANFC
ncbi:hypothetical protein B5F55_06655 [Anaerotruncus colihominis]|nr:hypothetical protein B5F55_06655 [Anaerotruncus colihominis]